MTNYAALGSFEAFRSVVVEGVRPEWLSSTKFGHEFDLSLRMIFNMARRETERYLPSPQYILEPFKYLSPPDVRVIITAQDPYPRSQDAMGIAFHSLSDYCPYSAKAINANLVKYGHIAEESADSADYRPWLRQGVLLTNVSLTTKEGKSGEHAAPWKGVVREALLMAPKKAVALMLGRDAKSIISTLSTVYKIEHAHPASRGGEFETRDIFGEVNADLVRLGYAPINWTPGRA